MAAKAHRLHVGALAVAVGGLQDRQPQVHDGRRATSTTSTIACATRCATRAAAPRINLFVDYYAKAGAGDPQSAARDAADVCAADAAAALTEAEGGAMRIVLVGASGTIGQAVGGGAGRAVTTSSRSAARAATCGWTSPTAPRSAPARADRPVRRRDRHRRQGQVRPLGRLDHDGFRLGLARQADGPGQPRPARPRPRRRRRLVHADQRPPQPRPDPRRQPRPRGQRRHRRLRPRGRDRAAARPAHQRREPRLLRNCRATAPFSPATRRSPPPASPWPTSRASRVRSPARSSASSDDGRSRGTGRIER